MQQKMQQKGFRAKWAQALAVWTVSLAVLTVATVVIFAVNLLKTSSLKLREENLAKWENDLIMREQALEESKEAVKNWSQSLRETEKHLMSRSDSLNAISETQERREKILSEREEYLDSVSAELFSLDISEEEEPVTATYAVAMVRAVQPVQPVKNPTTLSDEEYSWFGRAVFGEAGDQSYEGKLAVAEVIRNRLESEIFPDTVKGIITQSGQFSIYYNGDIRFADGRVITDADVDEDSWKAVEAALAGSNTTEPLLQQEANRLGITDSSYWEGGALYFANLAGVKNAKWLEQIKRVKVRIEIGDHNFRRLYTE